MGGGKQWPWRVGGWQVTKVQCGATDCLMASSLCSSYYFILMVLIKHVMGSLIIVEEELKKLKMF